jgi:hypothetical protein
MCHEEWWRERRARRAEESREVWLDFERTRPVDEPVVPDDERDITRLEDEDEAVTAER